MSPNHRSANPGSRLVIVVRADPVICGHSGEARNLAEAARERGVDEVRILTWPIEALDALPLKPLDSVLPYSPGIIVERPAPVGDYKVPDGRFVAGLVGRLVELFTDGVPTVCLSLYLSPHANVAMEALSVAKVLGPTDHIRTAAEAVGSDITNVVRSCLSEGRTGAAAAVFATYLSHDRCVAVSAYTKKLIVESAAEVDAVLGSDFAATCERRVRISYPAIHAEAFTSISPSAVESALARRGLRPDGYVLFLSRLSPAKGADDLIAGYARSRTGQCLPLVIAGSGPGREAAVARADELGVAGRVLFLDDVDDAEKPLLMAGCAAYVLPSKPMPEFVETFGIALVEKMLAGGGSVITTATGGIPEAVGDTATIIKPASPDAIASALDANVLDRSDAERHKAADRARTFGLRFDRLAIYDRLFTDWLPTGDPTGLPADDATDEVAIDATDAGGSTGSRSPIASGVHPAAVEHPATRDDRSLTVA